MPRAIATETAKAIDIRPILLNFMRFLRPRQRSAYDRLVLRANLWGTIPSPIVEGAATLCHFAGSERAAKHSSFNLLPPLTDVSTKEGTATGRPFFRLHPS
jgi:hypothetical protein